MVPYPLFFCIALATQSLVWEPLPKKALQELCTLLKVPCWRSHKHTYITENISPLIHLRSPNLRPLCGFCAEKCHPGKKETVWLIGSCDDARCRMPKHYPGFDKRYERNGSYPNRWENVISIKIIQTSELKKRKDPPPPRDDCFLLLEKCCFQFVWRNSTFYFCHFKPFSSISHLANLQNQMTPPFWIAVGSAPVLHRRAGQGDMVAKW